CPTGSQLCGRVVSADVSNSAVAGATVKLTDNAGNVLFTTTTDATGSFAFPSVTGATLIRVDVAGSPPAYYSSVVVFNGKQFNTAIQNQAGTGPCLPAIGTVSAGTKLPDLRLYSTAGGPPPPPIFPCPR